ncbi:MAG TPA: amino acid adenylation domain-containing protein [Solirubrobacterales bacterium]|nr:amino acid adenylation domain-containing protein [Solirubrobacterales bacterium]
MRFSALHEAFSARAREQPDAEAVVDAGGAVNRGELERRSAHVASWLTEHKRGPEDAPVAVCADRSPDLIAGLLGVLRAGMAYLPIDPTLPSQRISTLLHDSGARLVLADRAAEKLFPDLDDATIATLSGQSLEGWRDSPQVSPADLACVIYTSGSTGTPKGVLCTHGGIDNRLRWMQKAFRLTPRDIVLHKASIGFDVSVWEIFWPLSEGARLALTPAGAEKDPELLGRFIRQRQVTVAHFVPAMLRMFVRSGEAKRTPSLRLVVCSGEALPADLRDDFLAVSGAQLHNLYGPTEASIDVTHHACKRGEPARSVPIGRPIDNVRIRVLGERQEILPPGTEGEIHIGGIALARGYHRRPDLTATAFVPDPFEPGSLLYRTGDRGTWLPNGELEYCGRLDDQVKVRGVRIELGEVEATLSSLAGVRDCAVVPADAEGGGLVGFVDASAPSEDELRGWLAERLPQAAIPAKLIRLPSIPRLPSGKVDRTALRAARGETRASGPRDGRRPEGEAETTLARIWSEILTVPKDSIDADANFFALGGDSIRSIEVVFRARSNGLKLTTQDVFRWQTLAAIAAAVDGTEGVEADGGSPQLPFALLNREDREKLAPAVVDAFPLSSLLRGLMAEAAANPGYLLYTTTLTLRGRYDRGALERSVRELVRRHPMLRSAVAMEGFSQPLQLVFADAAAAVDEVDATETTEADWATYFQAWIERERRRRLDFGVPPLFRFTAHQRSGHFHLTLTEPYLDGWSMTLLLSELLTFYDTDLGGHEPALPPPPRVTMADLVAAEQALAHDGRRPPWRSRLAETGGCRLPRVGGGSHLGGPKRVQVPVTTGTSQRLGELANSLGVPLKSVLLAAHFRVMAAITGSDEVICGQMVNGRPEAEDGERAIGMFLNVVPLQVSVASGTWIELIQAVNEAEVDILKWRRYPYQWLLKDLGGRQPFETIFNFTHFRPYSAWRGGTVDLLRIEGTDQTYFGLTLQTGVGLDGEIEFALELNPEGFSDQQVAELVAIYERTLAQMAADPNSRHEAAPLVAPPPVPRDSRRRQVSPDRIETVLARRAADSADAPAFLQGPNRRSYAELDQAAERVAREMLGILDGVPPNLVAVRMGRSIRALEAIFGALKLGAAFLPVDPGLPAGRAEMILRDAGPELLVVAAGSRDENPSGQVLSLPAAVSESAEVDDSLPLSARENANGPAYLLYTSGSAGLPKGVSTPHAAVLNRLRWISRAFPAEPGDIYCASGSIGFVDTITTLLSGLLDGIPVFLPPDPPLPPARFARAVHDAGVTRLTLVPSVLRDLLWELGDDEAAHLFSSVRIWLLSGEPLPVALARRLRSIAPHSTILNLYGSTEVTGDVAVHVCDGDETGPLVPAGTAIDGVEIQVLDRHGRDLPIGASGEVVVSGAALADGYLGDTALTEQRFVPSGAGQPRRFHTGDRGRLRGDGSLELHGRIDRQLKINGVRVEPAEVESEISAHPTVREAAVCEVDRSNGGSRLAAFVVGEVSAAELRSFLAGRLPSAMIPSAVVRVSRLPRNASGKVDYQKLEGNVPSSGRPATNDSDPSETERAVLEIWDEVLGCGRIELDDDFFELGGDSLLAARVLARIEERLGTRIGLRELFDAATPRACAARVGAGSLSRRDEVAGVGH